LYHTRPVLLYILEGPCHWSSLEFVASHPLLTGNLFRNSIGQAMSSSVSCSPLCSSFVYPYSPSPSLWDCTRAKSLPNDVLLVVRDYLAEGKQNESLTRLARASKGFRDIFQPAIRCEELVVSKDNVERTFWGLTGCMYGDSQTRR
jgi:hypothetical protein